MTKLMVLFSLLSMFGCQSPWKGFENDTITSFSLSEGGGMDRFSGFGYSVRETKDGKVHFLFDEGLPGEKEFTLDDHSVFDSLQQLVAISPMESPGTRVWTMRRGKASVPAVICMAPTAIAKRFKRSSNVSITGKQCPLPQMKWCRSFTNMERSVTPSSVRTTMRC